MSEILVNTIKKADGTGSITVPAETGTVVIKDGSNDVTLNDITAGGIYLGGTGAANKLDDYETGTFTPSLSYDGGTTGISYASQQGRYIKIGEFVFCKARVKLSNKGSSTGNIWIENTFPFAPTDDFTSVDYEGGSTFTAYNTGGNSKQLSYMNNPASQRLELKEYKAQSVGWDTSITNSDIGNNFEVRIEYYFRTDA